MIRAAAILAAGFVATASGPALAQEASGDTKPIPADQVFAVHGQATFVAQGVGGFASPYVGTNSLTPHQVKETFDATAFIGVRPWAGAELWVNPEIDQGFGLSNTLGAAGFPSAEAYKVGKASPYLKLQRMFFRQTIGLGGERQAVDTAQNQLAGGQDANRIVLTIGKFSVGDVFDTNAYAHDPRGDFLNWSVVDAGTFDYAANAWGYSYGVSGEWYTGAWTLRLGGFDLSKIPNGEALETGFAQYQIDAEIEHRHTVAGRAGAVRVTVFRNRGQFSAFDDAVAYALATGNPVDPVPTRRRLTRLGVHVNAEQALTDTLGLFARIGYADGSIEPYDFTDIDRTAQLGGALAGTGWGRANDKIGLALVVNGISPAHERYLAAGGIGVLVGDGRLPDAGAEQIAELYYDVAALKDVNVTVDAQHIANPGYNRDRGPANVLAVRVHGAF